MEYSNSAASCARSDVPANSIPTHIQDTLQSRRARATSAYLGLPQDLRNLITQDHYIETYMAGYPALTWTGA